MRRTLSRILSLALCAAAACALPVFAAETKDANIETPDYPVPVRVWGHLTKQEDGGLLVRNDGPNDPYREIVLHGESIRILDAVSGMPLDRGLRDGETVYAWVGPAMTSSLPPHATAHLIVANIPADAGAPQYYQLASVQQGYTMPTAEDPVPHLCEIAAVTTDGHTLRITDEAILFPYLTKQMVSLGSLVPGSRVLVWTGAQGEVTKVMLFAYGYKGYLSWTDAGEVSANGRPLPSAGRAADGEVLLPIRAVAEAAGYTVRWVSGQGAVVSDGGRSVFSVLPGQDTAHTAAGQRALTGACYYESGTTYLPAADLASLLELFPELRSPAPGAL